MSEKGKSSTNDVSALFMLHQRLRGPHDFSRDEIDVAFAIAGYMDRKESGRLEAWPAIPTIAHVAGMSCRRVENALEDQRLRSIPPSERPLKKRPPFKPELLDVPLFSRVSSIANKETRQHRLNRYRWIEDHQAYAAEVDARRGRLHLAPSAATGGGTPSAATGGGTTSASAATGSGTGEGASASVPPFRPLSPAISVAESRQNGTGVPPPVAEEDSGRSEVEEKIARARPLRDVLASISRPIGRSERTRTRFARQ